MLEPINSNNPTLTYSRPNPMPLAGITAQRGHKNLFPIYSHYSIDNTAQKTSAVVVRRLNCDPSIPCRSTGLSPSINLSRRDQQRPYTGTQFSHRCNPNTIYIYSSYIRGENGSRRPHGSGGTRLYRFCGVPCYRGDTVDAGKPNQN